MFPLVQLKRVREGDGVLCVLTQVNGSVLSQMIPKSFLQTNFICLSSSSFVSGDTNSRCGWMNDINLSLLVL